jgi:hypothetical protein
METPTKATPSRITRQQAPEFLTAIGFPISKRYFEKLCVPSGGQGPRVDAWFGARALYLESDLRAWAESRCRPGDPPANCRAASPLPSKLTTIAA